MSLSNPRLEKEAAPLFPPDIPDPLNCINIKNVKTNAKTAWDTNKKVFINLSV